jgi:predicted O-methyltransferase YrrM
MQSDTWKLVDDYFAQRLLDSDPELESVPEANAAAGLPPKVSPLQRKLLYLLARLQRARRILEVGTLGGYSTAWLARAFPSDGTLITLELDPERARIARGNFARLGLQTRVEVIVGPASRSLDQVVREKTMFDMIFLDADNENNPEYLRRAVQLSRRGTLLVAADVVRGGTVAAPGAGDAQVTGIRRFTEMLRAQGVSATAIQTVGEKGYDGFVLGIVG